ncbi:hypothetical protein P692DRAFT_20873518 [Suillus brevipes Sb2]|nr:hypothetical protein P692DRAFT_20873518 [Suillus brevipes Sb2]
MQTHSRIVHYNHDLSADQVSWLEEQDPSRSWAHQDDDTSFLPSVFERFFVRWPVRKMMWPSIPTHHRLTEEDVKLEQDGENQLKAYITAFFELRRILSDSNVAIDGGNWTVDQSVWLADHIDTYISAVLAADLNSFWCSVFDFFFQVWPIRDVLWPTMPASRDLTGIQRRFLSVAEEQYKRRLKAFFRTHAYSQILSDDGLF